MDSPNPLVSSSFSLNKILDDFKISYIIYFYSELFLKFHGKCNFNSFNFKPVINRLRYECFFLLYQHKPYIQHTADQSLLRTPCNKTVSSQMPSDLKTPVGFTIKKRLGLNITQELTNLCAHVNVSSANIPASFHANLSESWFFRNETTDFFYNFFILSHFFTIFFNLGSIFLSH